MAREGGIGVLHKNMTIAEQADKVRMVKRAESGMILDPVTLTKMLQWGTHSKIWRPIKLGGFQLLISRVN